MTEKTQHSPVDDVAADRTWVLALVQVPERSPVEETRATPAVGSPTTEAPAVGSPTTEAPAKETEAKPAVPVPDVSERLLDTMLNTRAWCKATDRTVSGYSWTGALGLVTALITSFTALEIFTNLQANQTTLTARIVVGSVLVVSALVGTLQTWTARRTEALGAQVKALHELHRDIAKAIENRTAEKPISDDDVDAFERRLADIRTGTFINVSERRFDAARTSLQQDVEWRADPKVHQMLNRTSPTRSGTST